MTRKQLSEFLAKCHALEVDLGKAADHGRITLQEYEFLLALVVKTKQRVQGRWLSIEKAEMLLKSATNGISHR